ncbi:MAG: tetratricopeptide (TPR) repeat protein [Verrucomicrobiales bacterium]|jgi:tetratricopeptide (TPR) repeat protein
MSIQEEIAEIKAASKEPHGLTLRMIRQEIGENPDLMRALESAAVPHWFDRERLAKILPDDLAPDADSWFQQLLELSIVEPFLSRQDQDAHNVHEVSRDALRDHLQREDEGRRLIALSARVFAAIPAPGPDAPPELRIERIYHHLLAEPEAGARALGAQWQDWDVRGRWAELADLAAALEELLAPDPSPLTGRALAESLLWRVTIRADRGGDVSLEELAEQARASRDLFAKLGAEWREGLAHELIGNLSLERGDLVAALEAYREYRTIMERQAREAPDNTGTQRDLSVSHEKIGDVLAEQGDLAGALESYRVSMVMAEQLAASDPSNATWQRDLSVSHYRIGGVLAAQGERGEALESYRATIAIFEQLAASDPSNITSQRDLFVSHMKIGDVLAAQGERGEALKSFRAAMASAEQLAASDPSNAASRRDLAASYWKMADLAENDEDPEAEVWWRKCYETLQGMEDKGWFLSPNDERILLQVREKVGESN